MPTQTEGDLRVFVLVKPAKPYIPAVGLQEGGVNVKMRLTAVTRAEELLSTVEKVFHTGSIRTFFDFDISQSIVATSNANVAAASTPTPARPLVLYETEFAFADADPKRIPVVNTSQRLLEPIENATDLILGATVELDQLTIAQPLDTRALQDALKCFLFREGPHAPRLLCKEFLGSAKGASAASVDAVTAKREHELAMMMVHLLVFLKKALILHERTMADIKAEVDWQELAWENYSKLCLGIGVFIDGLRDLDRLSFVSIRPKLLSGELLKRGDKGFVKAWRARWFQQRGKMLHYYKTQKDADSNAASQGSIDLSTVGKVEERSDPAQVCSVVFLSVCVCLCVLLIFTDRDL